MARRGPKVLAESIVKSAAKKAGTSPGNYLDAKVIRDAEFEKGVPLEPAVAYLYAKYRTLSDAVKDLAAWQRTGKTGPPTSTEKGATSIGASVILQSWGRFRTETSGAKYRAIRNSLTGDRNDAEKVEAFLRAIHVEVKKLSGRAIGWWTVPGGRRLEKLLMSQSDDLQRWSLSPPMDIDDRVRRSGQIAGLIDAWTTLSELLLVFERPTIFFQTIAPRATPSLFDPDFLAVRRRSSEGLLNCLFVWGEAALLNPAVQAAFEGLKGGTTYYYRAVVSNPRGRMKGRVLSFRTPRCSP
jgi:hypothetical protein